MAQVEVCDGCGCQGELRAMVWMRRRDYCESCMQEAEKFVQAADQAQEEAADLFRSRMQRLREDCGLREMPV